jgi:hypothetical protein
MDKTRSFVFSLFVTIIVVFLHLSVSRLDSETETQQQQQGSITHTTTTLSQARYWLASTSSGELVFFGGGLSSTGKTSNRVDIYNVTSGSWTTISLFLEIILQPLPHKILSSLVEVRMVTTTIQ